MVALVGNKFVLYESVVVLELFSESFRVLNNHISVTLDFYHFLLCHIEPDAADNTVVGDVLFLKVKSDLFH